MNPKRAAYQIKLHQKMYDRTLKKYTTLFENDASHEEQAEAWRLFAAYKTSLDRLLLNAGKPITSGYEDWKAQLCKA